MDPEREAECSVLAGAGEGRAVARQTNAWLHTLLHGSLPHICDDDQIFVMNCWLSIVWLVERKAH